MIDALQICIDIAFLSINKYVNWKKILTLLSVQSGKNVAFDTREMKMNPMTPNVSKSIKLVRLEGQNKILSNS